MTSNSGSTPVSYPGVMVSSTFTDLVEHRAAFIKALTAHGFMPVAMEDSTARSDVNVISSSLEMVRQATAYALVIGDKYGQIPEAATENPDRLSLTELEFNEAVDLGRPVLLFVMSDDHPVPRRNAERDPEKLRKLEAFRERAKRWSQDSKVERVYAVFSDLQEFEREANKAVARLRTEIGEQPAASLPATPIPTAPALYAEPPYIGSHKFVGRKAQLDTLNDWAAAADPNPVLLFEAIGGTGKSMLTWEWTHNHAMKARTDWAGRFWYSFYEKGAVMADFCRRALAYTTGRPLETFRKKKTPELSELLLQQLRQHNWLLVLDGLERVLVAYHRFDAAQLRDEEAGTTDEIARRDPCAAIRPEDDDLLRTLASAAPSKLLITSRLVPRVRINPSGQPILGVRHERLPGLRPADAEALLRSCGISGDSQAIQSFLKSHCDCHPLVTGVLAGLINGYLPGRGNFDVWAAAADGGAALNLAKLDLVQKRNHILLAALKALPKKNRQLLSTLALLSEAVDYSTLSALNPHLPTAPEEVKEPTKPEERWLWGGMSEDDKTRAREEYEDSVRRREEYERAVDEWRRSPRVVKAPRELAITVRDLERRGLLQYDAQRQYYDLHPVVRGIAAGGLRQEEKVNYGQRVIDHFSSRSDASYDNVETLDDLSNGLHLVRTLLQMGRYQEAAYAFNGGLGLALRVNLEAHATVLTLLRPFFSDGWSNLPRYVERSSTASNLANLAGLSLVMAGEMVAALAAYGTAIQSDLENERWVELARQVANVSLSLLAENRIAAAERCSALSVGLASYLSEDEAFSARLDHFQCLSLQGRWSDAEEMRKLLDSLERPRDRDIYRSGLAELRFAEFLFRTGGLREPYLAHAKTLANAGKDRAIIRALHQLRGEWSLEHHQWADAASSLHEAVRMARAIQRSDAGAEAQLALANFHLGRLPNPLHEAEQLSNSNRRWDLDIASLWLAIGDRNQAKKHALAAYKWAWADGEPYVRRYDLNKSRALLEQLGAEIPDLPPYDPDKDPPFPWEKDVREAIEKLKAEKEKTT